MSKRILSILLPIYFLLSGCISFANCMETLGSLDSQISNQFNLDSFSSDYPQNLQILWWLHKEMSAISIRPAICGKAIKLYEKVLKEYADTNDSFPAGTQLNQLYSQIKKEIEVSYPNRSPGIDDPNAVALKDLEVRLSKKLEVPQLKSSKTNCKSIKNVSHEKTQLAQ